MRKPAWVGIGLICASLPLLILSGEGRVRTGGAEKWVARYDGPAGLYDQAVDIATDTEGNVFVTGISHAARYDSDFATVKYDQNGKQAWVKRYKGPGNGEDEAAGLVLDGSGNVYVTGKSLGSKSGLDFATIRYDQNGSQKWVKRYNGPGNGDDVPTAIAVDSSGNLFVAGTAAVSSAETDYVIIKYSPAGKPLWAKRYNSGSAVSDWAYDLAVDGAGSAIVTGQNSAGNTCTVKYSPDGARLWAKGFSGLDGNSDSGLAIAVDASNNIYVSGYHGLVDAVIVTAKFNSSGKQIWLNEYGGPAGGFDQPCDIAVDGAGNVLVAGTLNSSSSNSDAVTLKYSPGGKRLWAAIYKGPGDRDDTAKSIAVDGSGNAYITGSTWEPSLSGDYCTLKYSPNGKRLWVNLYKGPWSGDDAYAVAVDRSGRVYVTGGSVSYLAATDFDYATVMY